MVNWDSIKINDQLKSRLEKQNLQRFMDEHFHLYDSGELTKAEYSLLVNAERFISAVGHRTKMQNEITKVKD